MQVYKPDQFHSQILSSLLTIIGRLSIQFIHPSNSQPDHPTNLHSHPPLSPSSPICSCTMRRNDRRPALRITIDTSVETDPLLSPANSVSSGPYLTPLSPTSRSAFTRSYTSLASLGAEPPSRFATFIRNAKLTLQRAWERLLSLFFGEVEIVWGH
jgi:hypothetical protein